MPMPEDGGGLHEIQLRVVRVVGEKPGLTMRDLGGVLGVSPELVRYHVPTLQMRGLVDARRAGITTRLYPAGKTADT
jgi:predicted ArsR family transcriptional regulator